MERNIVAVTGASAGVGRAIAVAFAGRSTDGLHGARRDMSFAGFFSVCLLHAVATRGSTGEPPAHSY